MLNYRNHGDGMLVDHCSCYSTKPVSPDVAKVLIGFEVKPGTEKEFDAFLEKLKQKHFTCSEETSNEVYKQFLWEAPA